MALVALPGLTWDAAQGEDLELSLEAEHEPLAWSACHPSCQAENPRRVVFFDYGDGGIRAGDGATVRLAAGDAPHVIWMEWTPGPERVLEITHGRSMVPQAWAGFGGLYGGVDAVRVDADGQQRLAAEPLHVLEGASRVSIWMGFRSRFWTWLVQGNESLAAAEFLERDGLGVLRLSAATGQTLRLKIYAGPVEWRSLRAVDPVLSEMLFAALWDFLRWICFGLLILLGWIMAVVGSPGWSIILLSVCVKLLMYPLTRVADRWQQQVNETQSLLKPHLDRIKEKHRGEGAHRRTLAVYRRHGVHPMFTVKSLAGVLIQIPIFIGAFDMLAENFALYEQSFLWITDLSRPDRVASMPFALPWLGADINLLPFLMALFSGFAAAIQQDAGLEQTLRRRQQWRLYIMTAIFFLLFYTFPAGMVLYWTTNNVLHLMKILPARFR